MNMNMNDAEVKEPSAAEVKESSRENNNNNVNAEVKQSSVASERSAEVKESLRGESANGAHVQAADGKELFRGAATHNGAHVQQQQQQMVHMFKIQKIVDPLFDQDVQPDLWISWKHKIEVYCRSFGKCYVDVLKSKENVNKDEGPASKDAAGQMIAGGLWCKCTRSEDQQLVDIRKSQRVMCVSCGESKKMELKKDLEKEEAEQEMWQQRNAQIHGLLTTNMSNASFAKYCYNVKNGDGAQLWKLMCDANELYTSKLEMNIRQELIKETIPDTTKEPWQALSQLLDRLTSKFARLCLISSEPVNEKQMLVILGNAIDGHDTYKDLRTWMNLKEPSTFHEAMVYIRKEIVNGKIKEDQAKTTSAAEPQAAAKETEEKYHYAAENGYFNYFNRGGRGGYNNGRGRGGGRGGSFGQRIPFQQNNKRGRLGGRGPLTCFNCGGLSHRAADCSSPPRQQQDWQRQREGSNSLIPNSQRRDSNMDETLCVEEMANVVAMKDETNADAGPSTEIYLDSGASNHVFGNSDLLDEISKLDEPVCAVVANGNVVHISEVGQVQMQGFNNNTITIGQVRMCAAFKKNLLSVAQLVLRGLQVTFDQGGAVVRRGTTILLRAVRIQNMYVITNIVIRPTRNTESALLSTIPQETLRLWHHRLGHCDTAKIEAMKTNNIVGGIEDITINEENLRQSCSGCSLGKSTRTPFQDYSSRIPATRPLMRIFHDNSGAVNIPDEERPIIKKFIKVLKTEKYLSLIVDEYSGYLMGKPIYTKDESVDHLIDTITLEENQTGHRVQIVNADDAGEIRTKSLLEFFRLRGIIRNLTTKATPQHNAVVERAMRTVFEATRAMLIHAKLHHVFWGYAALAAIYALNLVPTHRDETKSRTEMFRGYKPSAKKLRVFGCDASVNIMKEDRLSKVDQNAILCIFLGYDEWRENGYLLFDPIQMCTFTSRDVIFHEDRFTCGRQMFGTSFNTTQRQLIAASPAPVAETTTMSEVKMSFDYSTPNPLQLFILPTKDEMEDSNSPERTSPILKASDVSVQGEQLPATSLPHVPGTNNNNANNSHRRTSARRRKYPDHLHDMIPSHLLTLSSAEEKDEHQATEQYCLVEDGPPNFADAMKQNDADEWIQACKAELESHKKNNSWTLVRRTNEIHVIPSRWVFVIKIDASTGARKYKARFVVKGFRQLSGVDYFEDQVSSSVLAAKSLRIILAISVGQRHELHQMDAVSAFTQSTLDQEVYAQQPAGFEEGLMLVCKLNKAVYGLKQASYLWQQDVKKFMIQLGFTPCILDENLFYKRLESGRLIMVGTYVDDIISSFHPQDRNEFNKFVESMKKRFTLKVIGKPESILGMKIVYDMKDKCLTLSHRQYIEQMLSGHNMGHTKPMPTPESEELLGPEHCPTTDSERKDMQKFPYRQVVGELLHLANTSRPDLSHCVGVLARFLETPGKKHWEACKRAMRYLAGTKDVGLMFDGERSQGSLQLEAYSDADWGRDIHGRKSIYGFIIHLNGCPIAWTSKKQTFVAQSTCESEYVGMSEAIREIRWIHQLLQELKFEVPTPVLLGDNDSAVMIASNTRMDNRIKSIDIKYHYIKDEVNAKHVMLQYVPTEDNLADIFTKPLARVKFNRLRGPMMGTYTHQE